MPQLDTLCLINTGASFRGRIIDEPAGTCRVVQLRDVDWDAGRIVWQGLDRVNGIEPRSHHLLRAGDVLFAAKGQTNGAVLVTEDGRAVATSSFFVIRARRPDVLGTYVAWYINTASAQVQLQKCARGTSLRSISKSCLGSLDLPLPPVETQHRIARAAQLAAEERELSSALLAKRGVLIEGTCLRMISPDAT